MMIVLANVNPDLMGAVIEICGLISIDALNHQVRVEYGEHPQQSVSLATVVSTLAVS